MGSRPEPLAKFEVFRALPDAVIIADCEGLVRYANPLALDLSGHSLESLIGQSLELVGLSEVSLSLDHHSPPHHIRTSLRSRQGETIPVEVRCGATDHGEYLICVIREVRITESEVVASVSQHGTSILDTLSEGVLVIDREEAISYANPQALQILGCPPGASERLRVRNVLQPISTETQDIDRGPGHFLDLAIAQGQALEDVEAVLTRADGSQTDVTVSASPIWCDDQSTCGAVVSFHDISRQKQSERQISVQRQVLESITAEEDLGRAGEIIVEYVEEVIPESRASLYLIDQDTGQIDWVASSRSAARPPGSRSDGDFDEHIQRLCGGVLEARQPLIIDCLASADRTDLPSDLADWLRQNDLHSCWCYPVVSSTSRAMGVLSLFRAQPGAPTTVDQSLIDAATSLARVALERVQIERDLKHQSFNDDLTGLPNRILLMDRLELALQRTARSDSKIALLLLDMDQFQMINDSLGHVVGDQFLKEAAERLQNCLRQDDLIARFTSDEFGILLEHIGNESDAINVVMRIQRAFAVPLRASGVEIYASVSIGMALASNQETEAGALVRYADIAMHRAKEIGRGQFAIFSPSQDLSRVPKIALQSRLHRALAADALQLYYQPVISLENSEVAGYESLVRWHDDQFGEISPDEFLPLAQQSGIMSEITAWVLDRAVLQATAWCEAHERPIFVGVNVSAGELNDPLLVEQVAAVIERYKLAPECLFLEMTEHALADLTGRTGDILNRLRGLGIRIALDDFGTGFSSLSYLERLPIDCIKIDRAFVQAARGGASRAPVAAAMVDLARRMGMLSVAEGVETEEDERVARQLGCDFSQGYLYGRPRPEFGNESVT